MLFQSFVQAHLDNIFFDMEESVEVAPVFQDSEVLWAKIRGYPWWPAFVSQVHPGDVPENSTYTVIFFGDNTNSRLGILKLRKFLEHYPTFYQKALKNKKLRISIQKAEERLKDNNENITIYENIRNSFKNKKKKSLAKSQSKLSSDDKGSLQDIPKLYKNKTQPAKRGRKPLIKQSQTEKIHKQKISDEQDNDINFEDDERQNAFSQMKIQQQQKSINLSNQAGHSSSMKLPLRNTRLRAKKQQRSQNVSESESEQQQQKSSSKKVVFVKRGRKGRPKKILKQISSDSQKQFSVISSEKRGQKNNRKRRMVGRIKGRRPFVARKLNEQQNLSNQKNISLRIAKDVQKIQQILDNKPELIKLLMSMNITTQNIKQILDLGITDILLDGTISKTIFVLLNSLKATLLHKYFPEDTKHRKKYEKLQKQKLKLQMQQFHNNRDENNQNQSNMMLQQGSKRQEQNNDDQQQLAQYNDIRKKTVQKLEKMIKRLEANIQNPQQCALKIQRTFQQRSQQQNQKYNKVAYQHMRAIKTKFNQFNNNKAQNGKIRKYINSLFFMSKDDQRLHDADFEDVVVDNEQQLIEKNQENEQKNNEHQIKKQKQYQEQQDQQQQQQEQEQQEEQQNTHKNDHKNSQQKISVSSHKENKQSPQKQ